MTKSERKTVNWNFLSNKMVADAFRRFVNGSSTVKEVRTELKNTEYSRVFNRLLKDRGVLKTKDAARLALTRRGLR